MSIEVKCEADFQLQYASRVFSIRTDYKIFHFAEDCNVQKFDPFLFTACF